MNAGHFTSYFLARVLYRPTNRQQREVPGSTRTKYTDNQGYRVLIYWEDGVVYLCTEYPGAHDVELRSAAGALKS